MSTASSSIIFYFGAKVASFIFTVFKIVFRKKIYDGRPRRQQPGNENMRGLADAVRGKVAPFAGRFA